jgi:hypothetical protein
MTTQPPIPIVASDKEVTQFILEALCRWVNSIPQEKVRERLPSGAHVDSLVAGLEKRGIATEEFKGRLWARMEGRRWKRTTPTIKKCSASRLKKEMIFKGKKEAFPTAIVMLRSLLIKFAKEDDTFLERLYQSGRCSSPARKLIARTKESLFPKSPHLVENYAKRLIDDWFIGTNFSGEIIYSHIKTISEFAGLEFGKDVIVEFESSNGTIDISWQCKT